MAEEESAAATAAIVEEEEGAPTRLWVSVNNLSQKKPVTLFVEDVDKTRGATSGENAAVASTVSDLVTETIKAEILYQQDQAKVAVESVDSVVDEAIRTELQHKAQATTHDKVPYTELTLALIKPDALKAGYEREIRYTMQAHGFVIVHESQIQVMLSLGFAISSPRDGFLLAAFFVLPRRLMINRIPALWMQFTKVRAALFYDHHQDKPWFEKLTRYMSSAPVHAFVLGKVRAARSWNVAIGPTDPEQARKESPLSLRARFGKDILRNAVHGSFNAARARHEIKLLFPNLILDPLLDPPKARFYFDKFLKKTLIEGLTALATAKPHSEPLQVIRWFAQWLQHHNPYRPFVDGKKHVEVVIPD
ncbi:nucleoside diphosphate kinase homolog 5-like [Selaginella moellendorffii]|uniref:nucleoside diphosphate kinase homolog 5-like n=1 Tax=Selaginella moellendorffii TaxID=88036 RepID=UPI000D1CA695|nr:nucleoside diphosphate kinase homolog 5-like [Selaginella moellendorffii]|eukprot:XP_024544034.1 nucleoside diphosphate kinase homolog 5-like [Selaginella moellendorffii]